MSHGVGMRSAKDGQPDSLKPLQAFCTKGHLAALRRHLERIHEHQKLDAHGNRKLFLKDILIAQLLAFYQPAARSLRTLDAFSQTRMVRSDTDIRRICRSTLSDANQLADAELLQPLLADLARRVAPCRIDADLSTLLHRLVAVDGTFLRHVGELAWALRQRADNGKTISKPRLDVQLDVKSSLPRVVTLSGRETSECQAAARSVEAGAIYLGDKAYFAFDLLNAWLDGNADFVVALNSQIRFTPEADMACKPSAGPVAAGDGPPIVSDRLGHLPGCQHSRPPGQMLREVILRCDDGEELRLLTSLTDPAISPQTIVLLYRQRWQIELFFRWLKCVANFDHLISQSQNGLSVALYTAIIGTLLTAGATGAAPSKVTWVILSFIANGLTTLDEMQEALQRDARERELARIRREKKRLAKNG